MQHAATRATKIRLAWSDQKAIHSIMVFPRSHGVGTSRVVRICKTYGAVGDGISEANAIFLGCGC
jgi:hypothetical protein